MPEEPKSDVPDDFAQRVDSAAPGLLREFWDFLRTEALVADADNCGAAVVRRAAGPRRHRPRPADLHVVLSDWHEAIGTEDSGQRKRRRASVAPARVFLGADVRNVEIDN